MLAWGGLDLIISRGPVACAFHVPGTLFVFWDVPSLDLVVVAAAVGIDDVVAVVAIVVHHCFSVWSFLVY